MDKRELLYGDQSFDALRKAGCFKVYDLHIEMLKAQAKYVNEHPETYDIFSRLGYVDFNRIKQIEDGIKFFEALIQQADKLEDIT